MNFTRSEKLCVFAILALAAGLRLFALDDIPHGMNQDEVIKGYDAWCLWKTGADYRDTPWPAFLGSFGPGDSPSAVSAYLTAPFVGLLGPRAWTARFPIALCGMATVALTWWWARAWLGVVGGLAAAAILAVNPWHVQISRLAFEGCLSPFFIMLGFCLWLRPSRSHPITAAFGGATLGVAMWSYHSPRVAVPLLILAAGLTLVRGVPASRRFTRWMLLGAATGSLPLWWIAANDPSRVFGRAGEVALFQSAAHFGLDLLQFARQYASHFDPGMLFLTGDARMNQSAPYVGMLQWFEAPLLLLGVVALCRRVPRDDFARFLLAWGLIYPLAPSLARDGGPHMVRDAVGLPLPMLVEAIGLLAIREYLAAGRSAIPRWTVSMCLTLTVTSSIWFGKQYYLVFPKSSEAAFQSELKTAFRWIASYAGRYDAGLFAFPAHQPFAYYLYFTPVEPRAAQSAVVRRTKWLLGFEQVLEWDRWQFCPMSERNGWSQQDVDAKATLLPPDQRLLIVARPSRKLSGRVLHVVRNSAERPVLLILESFSRGS